MTSASVALADCFFGFLYPHTHDFTSPGRLLVNLDQFGPVEPARLVEARELVG